MNQKQSDRFKTLRRFGFLVGATTLFFGVARLQAQNITTVVEPVLSIMPQALSFGVVFPEEKLLRDLDVSLSQSFLENPIADDVEYRIRQLPKPRNESDAAYCEAHPSDLTRCYPSLCPYLSKHPDGVPQNDHGIDALHDPNASSSIALGRLAKSESDTQDNWIIDLLVPCFRGECAQDNVIPRAYEIDPALHGQTFGCNLSIEVTSISTNACVDSSTFVLAGAMLTDPSPKIIHTYADLGGCEASTTHDILVDGTITFPSSCNKGTIRGAAVKVTSSSKIEFTRGDGVLLLESTLRSMTVGGTVITRSRDPITVKANSELLIDGATIASINGNGDISIESQKDMEISSSTLYVGASLGATTSTGDIIALSCKTSLCRIELLDVLLGPRVFTGLSDGNFIMRGSELVGHDPRGNYKITSTHGSVDLGKGTCNRPNNLHDTTEGNLTLLGSEDVNLIGALIRIPEFIMVNATSGIINASFADISNNFAKPGDILMTAGSGTHAITITGATFIDDNQAAHDFSVLNGGDNPASSSRAIHHVLGVPALDN